MQILLRKTEDGFQLQGSAGRIKAALELNDEIVVDAVGMGPVLLMKLPDGRIMLSQDEHALEVFGAR